MMHELSMMGRVDDGDVPPSTRQLINLNTTVMILNEIFDTMLKNQFEFYNIQL